MSAYQCPDCGSRTQVNIASNDNTNREAFECNSCGCYWEVDKYGIIVVQNSGGNV